MFPDNYINQIIHGDCLEVMKGIPDNSIDSIITDPPYHLTSINKRFRKTSLSDDNKTGNDARNGNHQYARLSKGFMGKDWDGGGIAFNPELWAEVLRIAKPGAFLFAFGGTRTYHRLTCAIEDAGWEIRDSIEYLHSPSDEWEIFWNSLNPDQQQALLNLTGDGLLGWVYGTGFPKSHSISKSIDSRLGAKREVTGYHDTRGDYDGRNRQSSAINNRWREAEGREDYVDISKKAISLPVTPQAQLFSGYGTALKPAIEPIIVAMKPVEGGFADNALKWGISGLNINGLRIEVDDHDKELRQVIGSLPADKSDCKGFTRPWMQDKEKIIQIQTEAMERFRNLGRWPANLIIDEESAKELGNTSRFFYIAKASRSERGDYNNHPTVKPLELLKAIATLSRTPTGGIILDPFGGSGSTALAAIKSGRQYLIIEKELEYVEIARKRVAEWGAKTLLKAIREEREVKKEQGGKVEATQMELPQ
jgi:DNA modification methylase